MNVFYDLTKAPYTLFPLDGRLQLSLSALTGMATRNKSRMVSMIVNTDFDELI
jgi:hypothetical protein